MFDSSAFCPKCGSARARMTGDRTSARCPGCKNELQHVSLGATAIMECAACDGVWVDAGAFEKLCADREVQAAILHRFPTTRGATAEPVRYRPCVRCGKMMNRVNFGRVSGTVLDVCRGHGTYLDTGELHQIVSFIHAGGLERAREMQMEDLREQERRLRALEERANHEWARRRQDIAPGATDAAADALLELICLITDRSG